LVPAASASKVTAAQLPLKALAHPLWVYPQQVVVEAETITAALVALEVPAVVLEGEPMLLAAQEFLDRVLTVVAPQTPVPLAAVVAARAQLVETRLLAATELLVMVERAVPMRYKRDQTSPMQAVAEVLVSPAAL
jgi:hypothetical protein